ncbi:MAG: rhomboid family intramembrane serine protease [Phycisphaerales bacterium]
MIIPLGTDRPLRRPTLVNHALIAANVAVFLGQVFVERFAPDRAGEIFAELTLDPRNVLPWTLLTHAFLHGGALHLLGNMVFLWSFGANVEDRFGRIGYTVFYLLGALAAGGLHALFDPHPVVGASGAIAAVTGAYLVLFPHTIIRCFVWFFLIGVYGIPALWFIGGQIAYNVLMQGSGFTGNVAVLAHLGGYGFGIAVALALLATRILPREPYDLFTLSRQAARRRQFREIAYQRDRTAREGINPDLARVKLDPQKSDAIATARAAVASAVSSGDPSAAAAAYRRLLEDSGVGAALLNRRAQYDLANYLFQSGDHQTAATAYDLFLKGYPTDSELPTVRLMLGLINARYLNDPIRAKQEINAAMAGLPEGDNLALARELLAELG